MKGPLHPRLHRLRRDQRPQDRGRPFPIACAWSASRPGRNVERLAEQVARAPPAGGLRGDGRGARPSSGRLVDLSGVRVGVGVAGMVGRRHARRRAHRGGRGGGRRGPGADLPRAGGGQGRGARQQGDPGDGRRADGGRRRAAAAAGCCPSTASTARCTSAWTAARPPEVRRLVLTASGGPFRTRAAGDLRRHHARRGAQPPDLVDGPQDHHRLRDPDEQGPGGDRGALAVRRRRRTGSRC